MSSFTEQNTLHMYSNPENVCKSFNYWLGFVIITQDACGHRIWSHLWNDQSLRTKSQLSSQRIMFLDYSGGLSERRQSDAFGLFVYPDYGRQPQDRFEAWDRRDVGNIGDCPNWCSLCSNPKGPCSAFWSPSHSISHPLSFNSLCLFTGVFFFPSIILVVVLTPFPPSMLFKLYFLSLTSKRNKSRYFKNSQSRNGWKGDKAKKKKKITGLSVGVWSYDQQGEWGGLCVILLTITSGLDPVDLQPLASDTFRFHLSPLWIPDGCCIAHFLFEPFL